MLAQVLIQLIYLCVTFANEFNSVWSAHKNNGNISSDIICQTLFMIAVPKNVKKMIKLLYLIRT